mmetsp:Transcript_21935/g.60713  ORF Transcript_21935/g.60713 Transcript_21935/m.60713 type:complete len:298 (-) Transcript_21935:1500-2393(-)
MSRAVTRRLVIDQTCRRPWHPHASACLHMQGHCCGASLRRPRSRGAGSGCTEARRPSRSRPPWPPSPGCGASLAALDASQGPLALATGAGGSNSPGPRKPLTPWPALPRRRGWAPPECVGAWPAWQAACTKQPPATACRRSSGTSACATLPVAVACMRQCGPQRLAQLPATVACMRRCGPQGCEKLPAAVACTRRCGPQALVKLPAVLAPAQPQDPTLQRPRASPSRSARLSCLPRPREGAGCRGPPSSACTHGATIGPLPSARSPCPPLAPVRAAGRAEQCHLPWKTLGRSWCASA